MRIAFSAPPRRDGLSTSAVALILLVVSRGINGSSSCFPLGLVGRIVILFVRPLAVTPSGRSRLRLAKMNFGEASWILTRRGRCDIGEQVCMTSSDTGNGLRGKERS
jgi:hypothetical protein